MKIFYCSCYYTTRWSMASRQQCKKYLIYTQDCVIYPFDSSVEVGLIDAWQASTRAYLSQAAWVKVACTFTCSNFPRYTHHHEVWSAANTCPACRSIRKQASPASRPSRNRIARRWRQSRIMYGCRARKIRGARTKIQTTLCWWRRGTIFDFALFSHIFAWFETHLSTVFAINTGKR